MPGKHAHTNLAKVAGVWRSTAHVTYRTASSSNCVAVTEGGINFLSEDKCKCEIIYSALDDLNRLKRVDSSQWGLIGFWFWKHFIAKMGPLLMHVRIWAIFLHKGAMLKIVPLCGENWLQVTRRLFEGRR